MKRTRAKKSRKTSIALAVTLSTCLAAFATFRLAPDVLPSCSITDRASSGVFSRMVIGGLLKREANREKNNLFHGIPSSAKAVDVSILVRIEKNGTATIVRATAKSPGSGSTDISSAARQHISFENMKRLPVSNAASEELFEFRVVR